MNLFQAYEHLPRVNPVPVMTHPAPTSRLPRVYPASNTALLSVSLIVLQLR